MNRGEENQCVDQRLSSRTGYTSFIHSHNRLRDRFDGAEQTTAYKMSLKLCGVL